MNAWRRSGLAGLAALLALAGCRPQTAPPRTATGERVISLAPSVTEIVCAIGAADVLVGRTSVCDYPPDKVAKVPVVGGFGDPSMELLVAAQPTLVLYADLADETLGRKLDGLGIRHARIRCARLDEIPTAIATIGALLHRASPADTLAANLRQRIHALRQAEPPPDQRPKVLAIIWHDPLTAAGKDSFLADLIALSGGNNIGDAADKDYFQVSAEWVVARDPAVVLCFFMAGSTPVLDLLRRQAGWDHVSAVRAGRVYSGFDNNVMLRPGPRVLEGVEALQRRIALPNP